MSGNAECNKLSIVEQILYLFITAVVTFDGYFKDDVNKDSHIVIWGEKQDLEWWMINNFHLEK